MKKADISGGRCPPKSRRVSLDSAHQGESNGIGLQASTCLYRSAGTKRQISHGADVRRSREGSHWSPFTEGNRMV